MAEVSRAAHWKFRGLFLLIAAVLFFVQLLPLASGAGRMPGPDVLLLVVAAWVLRRPDYVPVLLIAAVFLLADILFMRPLGLWTAIVILGTEFLRARSVAVRDWSFAVEWLVVAVTIAVMFLANALVLTLFMANDAPLGLTLIHLIATVLAYPLVVILGARAMGLQKIAPGEVDALGHRQ
ncbi:rod shape-determining protein MreD [Alphaproteobacteria bacterium GH1-50]|uniref:Rod shape-determining protein MreD n=1 Tax=Kangsaoukella pontilimi TaxID=2691042 RepID=A0A7C9MGG3_9RHOB|nr:rod shape-determining protein MreD [Kangsaoukella pontilimi]MXQ09532.1 rod shape-determining protein MreD [Kangsaoukella pontilimi]